MSSKAFLESITGHVYNNSLHGRLDKRAIDTRRRLLIHIFVYSFYKKVVFPTLFWLFIHKVLIIALINPFTKMQGLCNLGLRFGTRSYKNKTRISNSSEMKVIDIK